MNKIEIKLDIYLSFVPNDKIGVIDEWCNSQHPPIDCVMDVPDMGYIFDITEEQLQELKALLG